MTKRPSCFLPLRILYLYACMHGRKRAHVPTCTDMHTSPFLTAVKILLRLRKRACSTGNYANFCIHSCMCKYIHTAGGTREIVACPSIFTKAGIYIYIHTCIHTCIHACLQMPPPSDSTSADIYIYIYIHTCIHTYLHIHMHAYIHTCRCLLLPTRLLQISTYTYTYMHACIISTYTCIHTYIHTYIHADASSFRLDFPKWRHMYCV
jgi:hypothetical protein